MSLLNISGNGFFDHARLCEDLIFTWDLFSAPDGQSRPKSPPIAVLSRLGDDLLHALPDDHGAWKMRHNQDLLNKLRERTFCHWHNTVPINFASAVAIFGRRDLQHRHFRDSWLDMDAGLAWFVLYGVVEHRLWHYLTDKFLAPLGKKTVRFGMGNLISPLEHLLLIERPDIASRLSRVSEQRELNDQLLEWINSSAVKTYRLQWITSLFRSEDWIKAPESHEGLLDAECLPPEISALIDPARRSYSPAQLQFETFLRDRLTALPASQGGQCRIGCGALITLPETLIYGEFSEQADGFILIKNRVACFVIPPMGPSTSLLILETDLRAPTGVSAQMLIVPAAITPQAALDVLGNECSLIPLRLLPHGPGGSRILTILLHTIDGRSPENLQLLIRNFWVM